MNDIIDLLIKEVVMNQKEYQLWVRWNETSSESYQNVGDWQLVLETKDIEDLFIKKIKCDTSGKTKITQTITIKAYVNYE